MLRNKSPLFVSGTCKAKNLSHFERMPDLTSVRLRHADTKSVSIEDFIK
jgi:hypothetical protein